MLDDAEGIRARLCERFCLAREIARAEMSIPVQEKWEEDFWEQQRRRSGMQPVPVQRSRIVRGEEEKEEGEEEERMEERRRV